jgi:hypothetical protein
VESLYKEVDLVLKKFEIGVSVSQSVQTQTVAHALQKMFCSETHFDVCTIRSCAELCQIVIPKERMAVYSSIHCMRWSEMLPDYRQMIIAMVLDDFRSILNPAGDNCAV